MNSKEIVKRLLSEKRPDIKSVAGLERQIGISNGTINKWDKAAPSSKSLEKVAKFFSVSTDYLLGKDDNHSSSRPTVQSLDLREVKEEERNEVISAGGAPISDEDWAIIKAVLAKYPRRED